MKSELLIRNKRSSTKWKIKRLWDTVNADDMSFMNKVALLTPKGESAYNRIHDYYKKFRCEIAHGESLKVGHINLPVVAHELKLLARKFRR